jgi:hypothetical protein
MLRRNQAWRIIGLEQIENTITIIDAKGRAVYTSTNNQNTIHLDKLNSGLYFYQITTVNKNGIGKSYKGKLLVSD